MSWGDRKIVLLLVVFLLLLAGGLAWRVSGRGQETRETTVDLLQDLDRATVTTPDESYVLPSWMPVGSEGRPVLFAHPPSEIVYPDILIEKDTVLQVGLGFNQDAWSAAGDGAQFDLELVDAAGRQHVLLSHYVDPKNVVSDRHWFDYEIDLNRFAGQRVALHFRTGPGPAGDNGADWVGWSEPRLVRISNPSSPGHIFWVALISIPLLFLVPGYLIVGLVRPGLMGLDLSERLFLVVIVSVGVAGWLALLLAEVGLFSLWLLLGLLLVGCVIFALVFRHRLALSPFSSTGIKRHELAVAGILVVALLLLSVPAELNRGGNDPGTYLLAGTNIARSGSIIVQDELQTEVLAANASASASLVGWYPWRLGNGYVPHAFHLYSVWIAILYQIGGLPVAELSSGLFAFLAIAGVFAFARRLFHPVPAVLASLLLATNIGQIWFGRFMVAEMMVQFLVLAGLYALVLASRHSSMGFYGAVAGLMLGSAHLAKIDTFLIPIAVFLYLAYRSMTRRWGKSDWFLVVVYGALCLHAGLHGLLIAHSYVGGVYGVMVGISPNQVDSVRFIAQILAAAVPLLLLAAWLLRVAPRLNPLEQRLRQPALLLLGFVILGASVYGYFIRPASVNWDQSASPFLRQLDAEPELDEYLGTLERTYAEENLVRIGWYLTPPILWFGILGCAWLAWSRFDDTTVPFVVLFLLKTALVVVEANPNPVHFWAARRFMPVTVPGLLICAAFLIWRISQASPRVQGPIFRYVAVGIAIAFVAGTIATSAPWYNRIENKGWDEGMKSLAEAIPSPALIMIEPGWMTAQIAPVLRYGYDRDVIRLTATWQDAQVGELAARWWAEKGPVYCLSSEPEMDSKTPDFRFDPSSKIDLHWIESPRLLESLPRTMQERSASIYLFRLVPAAASSRPVGLSVAPGVTELVEPVES